jgi:hypothetical protein
MEDRGDAVFVGRHAQHDSKGMQYVSGSRFVHLTSMQGGGE